MTREQALEEAHKRINWLDDEYDLFYMFWNARKNKNIRYYKNYEEGYVLVDELELFRKLGYNKERILMFARLCIDFDYLWQKNNTDLDYIKTFMDYEKKTAGMQYRGNMNNNGFLEYVIDDIRSNDTMELYLREFPEKASVSIFTKAVMKEIYNPLIFGFNRYNAEFIYSLYINT